MDEPMIPRQIPHDLPEYVPNWPLAFKVKAKVTKGRAGWYWVHDCPRRAGVAFSYPLLDQPTAFYGALKHARGCW